MINKIINVVMSYGGMGRPLFFWSILCGVMALAVLAGVGRFIGTRLPRRGARGIYAAWLLAAWAWHAMMLVYTCAQVYRIRWVPSPGYSGYGPAPGELYNVAIVCLMIAATATVLLLFASFMIAVDIGMAAVDGGVGRRASSQDEPLRKEY